MSFGAALHLNEKAAEEINSFAKFGKTLGFSLSPTFAQDEVRKLQNAGERIEKRAQQATRLKESIAKYCTKMTTVTSKPPTADLTGALAKNCKTFGKKFPRSARTFQS
jgi:hypothetical protein